MLPSAARIITVCKYEFKITVESNLLIGCRKQFEGVFVNGNIVFGGEPTNVT